MGSDRHKWVRCIHGNRMICCRHRPTGCRPATPLATAYRAVTVPTCHNLSQGFPYPDSLGFRNRLSGRVCGDPILLSEDLLNLLCHFIVSEAAVFYRKIRDQLIWVMTDLINLVPVFVIIRMGGFHLVDLCIQCFFQGTVRIFSGINIFIRTGITGRNDCRGSSLQRCCTAGKAGCDQYKDQGKDSYRGKNPPVLCCHHLDRVFRFFRKLLCGSDRCILYFFTLSGCLILLLVTLLLKEFLQGRFLFLLCFSFHCVLRFISIGSLKYQPAPFCFIQNAFF